MKRRDGPFFVIPAFIHLLVFAIIPIGYALYLSFFRWNILKEHRPFIGLDNYAYLLKDSAFWNSMWNSTRFTLVAVPLGSAVALAIALLVHQKIRGMAIFRTIFYLPAISSQVAVAILWIYVFLPQNGLLNAGFGLVNHLFGTKIPTETDFLNNTTWAMWALVFMSIWTGLGPRMILFLAGLVGISRTLYEAAEIDGASSWQKFRFVTLPQLSQTTFFVLVTSAIASFQVFTPVYLMTRGGPESTTEVAGYHIYAEAWKQFNVGLASAKSFVLFAILLAFSIMQFLAMRKQLELNQA